MCAPVSVYVQLYVCVVYVHELVCVIVIKFKKCNATFVINSTRTALLANLP